MSKCTVCSDTGEVGQMGNLDCVACESAIHRNNLNEFIDECGPTADSDMAWMIHQRAIAMEHATALAALTRIAELYAVGDSSARIKLANEIARVMP